jgi:hypothetical protein
VCGQWSVNRGSGNILLIFFILLLSPTLMSFCSVLHLAAGKILKG